MHKRMDEPQQPGYSTAEILYQIFPDRFCNGCAELTPRPGEWNLRGRPIAVSDDPEVLGRKPDDQFTFFGGDVPGITSRLDYLADLGVTGVYLNPIFEARTTHRYDTVNYLRIDPHLGARRDFEELVRNLRARGMSLTLDGVFNHTSDEHPWYADLSVRQTHYLMKRGIGAAGETMSWMNSGHLPKLDTENPQVVEALLKVIDAWPEADMWRLDAGHLLPRSFLAKVREKAHPRPIIVEDWMFAPYYFEKKVADGVTNFLFRECVRNFFVEDCSPETMLDRLGAWIGHYPSEGIRYSWIYLDNHDTGRMIDAIGRDRLLRAFVLLMTLPGTPLIFQGTEMGMKGRDDAQARAPINWDRSTWDAEMVEHVKRLIGDRKAHAEVFVEGRYEPIFADNRSRTFAYARVNDRTGNRVTVAINDGYRACRVVDRGTEVDFDLGPGEWRVLHGAAR